MNANLPLFRFLIAPVLGTALSLAAANPTSAAMVYAAISGKMISRRDAEAQRICKSDIINLTS